MRWLVPETARTVLDLGAGTGKFTRLLVDAGYETIAVEPDQGMLDRLHAAMPSVDARVGTAESIPLDSDSVDAVAVAQAWHWVDAPAALPEVARVLRTGGTFGIVWNVRDQTVPWISELGAAMHESAAEAHFEQVAAVAEPFGPLERTVIHWSIPMDRARVVTLVTSRSYFITAEPDEQRRVLDAVNAVLDSVPGENYLMEYDTHCFRARLA